MFIKKSIKYLTIIICSVNINLYENDKQKNKIINYNRVYTLLKCVTCVTCVTKYQF